jgi:tungstate transport system ATP-binding protein
MYYGRKKVINIDGLTINRGEVLAVIGPNGSGKSTLLRLVAHLEKPQRGAIAFVDGSNAGSDLEARRRLAMVFQEPLLFRGTVYDNIAYGLRVRKDSKIDIDRRVQRIAEMLNISHLLDRAYNKLSGGEAQRTSLARAIILEPELLLLDEPMASLDPPTKEALLADLYRILREFNMAVVYVTHELTEALILANRWAVMDEGRVVQVGTSRQIMEQPINRKVADFVGVENIIEGHVLAVEGGLIKSQVNGSEVDAVQDTGVCKPGDRIWMLIRPENVTIVTMMGESAAQRSSARNQFVGTVEKIIDLGALYRVVVDCGFPIIALVTKQSVDEMGLNVGSRVGASFKATGIHIVSRESERVQV